jgi:hypothetical protein
VLWDPCASGRQFLREQRAISAIKLGVTSTADESVEIPGLRFDAATARDIAGLGIAKCAAPLGRRALVLTRADRPVERALRETSLGRDAVEHSEAVGQEELMDRYPSKQPFAAIDKVVAWLSEGAARSSTPVVAPPVAGPRAVGQSASGHAIVETPVTIAPAGLFGMLTHLEGAPPSANPTAIFLNVANQHHVGPTRLWVDLARLWANDGAVSLRLDMSGLGDSPGRPGDDRWGCNKPQNFDDVADAARGLCPEDPSNVVLVGMCSSGAQAIESALELRARGVMAINPTISFHPAERALGATLDTRRRIILPKGDVSSTFRKGGRLSGFRQRVPNLAWRVRILSSPERRSGKWLTQLVRQGTDTLMLCGDTEWRPIRNGTTAVHLRRLRHSKRLRLEHIPGLQHDLFVVDHRALAVRLLSGHFLSRFAKDEKSAPGPYSASRSARSSDTALRIADTD